MTRMPNSCFFFFLSNYEWNVVKLNAREKYGNNELKNDYFQLKDNVHYLTLSQTIPGFSVLQYKSFEDTTGEGDMLIMNNLSISHSIFYTF